MSPTLALVLSLLIAAVVIAAAIYPKTRPYVLWIGTAAAGLVGGLLLASRTRGGTLEPLPPPPPPPEPKAPEVEDRIKAQDDELKAVADAGRELSDLFDQDLTAARTEEDPQERAKRIREAIRKSRERRGEEDV